MRYVIVLSLVAITSFAKPPAEAPMLIPGAFSGPEDMARAFREHYTKFEHRIVMRDGVRLFTHVYAPKDPSRTYGIILVRTPYGIGPYGIDSYPTEARPLGLLAPAPTLLRHGFILAQQDVRGRMMSEGDFVDVRPVLESPGPRDIDETTDTWDTIDWLVKNVPNNNGRVGMWGISYPGFYAAQGLIRAHPALKAVSPQAPVTEWFLGDDFHHNGALFLADAFLFYADFGKARPAPVSKWKWEFDPETGDIYDFFLRLGPLANANARYFKGTIAFWNDLMTHSTRDAFWQARDPRPHLVGVKPAVMTVGGWFDAEDLYGTLETYRAIEAQSPGASNTLVMGPWQHGGWVRTDGAELGDVGFGARTSDFYREHIITPFFLHHLDGVGPDPSVEAWSFETGTNEWHAYSHWPPREAKPASLWFGEGGALTTSAPAGEGGSDAFISDPAKPVPYRERLANDREAGYMIEDQRFASRRPDVLVYATGPLAADVTLAGPLTAEVHLATTGTDADVVVKLVDAYPETVPDPNPNPRAVRMGGYQQLVRGEVMRARFRAGYERPEALVPGQPARIRFSLPDVSHTFRVGHRILVQVQSSWFPLVDRNPQTFVDIYAAKESDFRAATHTVLRSREHPSHVEVTLLRGAL